MVRWDGRLFTGRSVQAVTFSVALEVKNMLNERQRKQMEIEDANSGKALPSEILSPHEEVEDDLEAILSRFSGIEEMAPSGIVANAGTLIKDAMKAQNRNVEWMSVNPNGVGEREEIIEQALQSNEMTTQLAKKFERALNITLLDQSETPHPEEASSEDAEDLEAKVTQSFDELVMALRPGIQNVFLDALEQSYYTNAMDTWRGLSQWSKTKRCECGNHVAIDKYANHKNHYQNTTNHFGLVEKEYSKRAQSYGMKSKTCMLKVELQKVLSQTQATKQAREKGEEAPLQRYEVDWVRFRNMVNTVHRENPAIPNSAAPLLSTTNQALRGAEVQRLINQHPLLANAALRLKTIAKKVLHCSGKAGCGRSYWDPKEWPEQDHYFIRLADKIVRSVIETCVANTVIRPPKGVEFRDQHGEPQHVLIGSPSGVVSGDIDEAYINDLLGEAILSGFSITDNIEVKVDGEDTHWTAQKDEMDVDVHVAFGTAVVSRLASDLRSFKPLLAFLEEGQLSAKDEWAEDVSIRCLTAVNTSGHLFTIEKTKAQSIKYTDGTRPDSKTTPNLIRLTEDLHQRIREEFVHENGTNLLKARYHRERIAPMIVEPLARNPEMPEEGGYLTLAMQARKPMISDKDGVDHQGTPRFEPSEEAIEALNTLQKTTWTIDENAVEIAKAALQHELKTNLIERLIVRNRNGTYHLEFDRVDGDISRIRNGQVREWNDTFDFIHMLLEQYPGKPHFWHAWQFDWRGRMSPTTTMLSPQNDDFARGVLRFAHPVQIDEVGLLWLGRHTASLCRDLKHVGRLSKPEEYEELIDRLADRRWEAYDEVVANPLFTAMLTEISELDFVDGYVHWGQGDVFRTKAEGFQRFSAIQEFLRVHREGGLGVETRLPIHLDASSSIYQHSSAMLRDKTMAQEVNVAAHSSGGRADVYASVAGVLESMWESEDHVLFPEKDNLVTRSMAKGPVMTRGYGAGPSTIARTFLSHNGKENGRLGANGKAHPESKLAFISTGEYGTHTDIALELANGYLDAIKTKLPGFNTVLRTVQALVKASHDKTGRTLLTHNGKSSGSPGEGIHVKVRKIIQEVEGEKFGGQKVNAAHETSPLGFLRDLGVGDEYHQVVAIKMAKGKGSLTSLCKKYPVLADAKEQLHALVDSGKEGQPLVWLRAEGSPEGEMGRSLYVLGVHFHEEASEEGPGVEKMVTAHPDSALFAMIERTGIAPHYHQVVASVLAANSRTKFQTIMAVYPELHEHEEALTSFAERRHYRHGQSLKWTLPDGSSVINAYWPESNAVSRGGWDGPRGMREVARENLGASYAMIPGHLGMPVDYTNLADGTLTETQSQQLEELKAYESNRFTNLLRQLSDESLRQVVENGHEHFDWKELNRVLGLEDSPEPPSYADLYNAKHQDAQAFIHFMYPAKSELSFRRIVRVPARQDELTGVAPNFVHSFDALHMRRFIRDMSRKGMKGVNDLWAVHDSFGCHANHVELMRSVVRDQFIAIHQLTSPKGGLLLDLVQDTLPVTEQEAFTSQMGDLKAEDVNSEYFIN